MVILANGKTANFRVALENKDQAKEVIERLARLFPDSSPELHETIDGLHVWAHVQPKK